MNSISFSFIKKGSSSYVESSIDSGAEAEIARIGNVIVDNRVLLNRQWRLWLEMIGQRLGAELPDELVVTPEREVERVNHEDPVDGELVHLLRVQRS